MNVVAGVSVSVCSYGGDERDEEVRFCLMMRECVCVRERRRVAERKENG